MLVAHTKVKGGTKMTRGNFVLIEDGNIYMSIQFNGDMYPSGKGKYVYYMLRSIDSKGELKKAIKKFDEVKFGYAEEGFNISELEEMEDLDFSRKYFSRFNSDYLYIKNAGKEDYPIINRNGEKFIIKPDELQIWYYGEKKIDFDEAEMEMTDDEIEEISDIKRVRKGHTYSETSEEARLMKCIIKSILLYIRSSEVRTRFKMGGLVYSNDVFSINQHTVSQEIPNFEYSTVNRSLCKTNVEMSTDNIRVFWENDIDDNFVVESKIDITMKVIADVYEDCMKSLEKRA